MKHRFEIYNYEKKIESVLNRIEHLRIEQKNKRAILGFYKDCLPRGLSKARILKYLCTLESIVFVVGLFRLPLKYFGFHFAFYGVTGTGKTRAAMNLAIKSENEGLFLRVIDVEGEWKNIIPELKKDTVYYDVNKNLKINPFCLQDCGLTKLLLKETIFKGPFCAPPRL